MNVSSYKPRAKVARLPEPGARVGDFELVTELGRGGVGAVFEARHVSSDGRAAIKILLPGVMNETNITARFEREIRVAGSLRSQHTVRLYGVGVYGEGE